MSHAPIQLAGFSALWTSVALALVSACGGDLVLPGDDEPNALTIRIVNGDGQTGEVGEKLEQPLEVVVTDATGEPVRGATIVFELIAAGEGGEISPSPAKTNAAGQVEARVFLGDKVGLQTGAAHLVVGGEAGPAATFSALANPADSEKPGKDEDDEDDRDDD